jgi:CheY-like chemotaxis protein
MMDKTILIADDDAEFRAALTQRCTALGVHVQNASDGFDALMTVVRDDPDLLILDIHMPAGDGLGVAEKLLKDPRIRPIPVVFCTGRSDPQTIDRCKALGADFVTKGADVWSNLEPIIRRLLAIQGGAAPPTSVASIVAGFPAVEPKPANRLPKVLVVDDDADIRRVMQIRLRACGMDVFTASTAMQALWIAMKEMPDLIITDYRMPEGSGDYLMARLRAVPVLENIPIIVVTGESGGSQRDYALERRFRGEFGVAAFLSKPVDFGALLTALSHHIEIDAEVWRTASRLRRR